MEEGWSNDVEIVLEKIRTNAVNFNKTHKLKYFFYKSLEKYFRIPTIILSAFGSVSSVGLQGYLTQENISVITCALSLTVGIINSIELFLQIQENLEKELKNSKDFYTLAVDIHKTLNLERHHRGINGIKYLETKYSTFVKLVENGNLVGNNVIDVLISIPKKEPLLNMDKARKLLKMKRDIENPLNIPKPQEPLKDNSMNYEILNNSIIIEKNPQLFEVPSREEKLNVKNIIKNYQ